MPRITPCVRARFAIWIFNKVMNAAKLKSLLTEWFNDPVELDAEVLTILQDVDQGGYWFSLVRTATSYQTLKEDPKFKGKSILKEGKIRNNILMREELARGSKLIDAIIQVAVKKNQVSVHSPKTMEF